VSAIKGSANRSTSKRGRNPMQDLRVKMMRRRRSAVVGLGFSLLKEGPLFISYI
jgi:hypothetical protein